MKPLPIEELKALEVGDWVWVEYNYNSGKGYFRIDVSRTENALCAYKGVIKSSFAFDTYGKTWLAYKNKEQAEGLNDIKRFAEYVGSKIAGHGNYHGDDILSALYTAAEGREIGDVRPSEKYF